MANDTIKLIYQGNSVDLSFSDITVPGILLLYPNKSHIDVWPIVNDSGEPQRNCAFVYQIEFVIQSNYDI